MNVYLIAALVVAGLVAAAGIQGYRLGGDRVRAEYAQAAEDARKDAEERENWNRLLARGEAKNLQVALGKQRGLTHGLNAQLDDALKAAQKPPAGCPAPGLDAGLLDLWNAANRGADPPGRSLPGASRTAAGTDRPQPSRSDQEPR